jgi:predicted acetyltransferase
MSNDIIQLGAGDFDEAMAFLDQVFGEHAPHDFANLIPSIYQPTDTLMRCNYAVREGNRLGAIVGVFPITWRVGGVTLKVAGVGGVSVHPDSRGKGYMKLLMNHAVAEMRRGGYDLSYLGGRRQRYAYFGYEVAGTACRLNFGKDNVRHALADSDNRVTLEPLGDDPKINPQLKALHDARPSYCERTAETFHRHLRNWHCRPMVVRDAAGQIAGYISAQKEEPVVNEFVVKDTHTATEVVRTWIEQGNDKLTVVMQQPAGPILRHLHGFAETLHLYHEGNYQVFDWVKVVDALLKLKHETEPLIDGNVTIRIADADVTLALMIDGDLARCEATDKEPDINLDSLTAIRVLFNLGGPASVIQVPGRASALTAWCPLPLGFSWQDHV